MAIFNCYVSSPEGTNGHFWTPMFQNRGSHDKACGPPHIFVAPKKIEQSFTGWWFSHPSEKYEFVSWDDDIPNVWKNEKCSSHHQPDYFSGDCLFNLFGGYSPLLHDITRRNRLNEDIGHDSADTARFYWPSLKAGRLVHVMLPPAS